MTIKRTNSRSCARTLSFAALATFVATSVLTNAAHAKTADIGQSLQLAVTGAPCDSVLSPTQCLTVLTDLPAHQALQFNSVSLQSWASALEDIDLILQQVVDPKSDMARWQMLQGLAIQARHTVAKTAAAFDRSDKAQGPSVKNQIQRLEVVHRIVITGDRIMIDQLMIDRTSSRAVQHRQVDQTAPIEIVDVTHSLEAGLKSALKNLKSE